MDQRKSVRLWLGNEKEPREIGAYVAAERHEHEPEPISRVVVLGGAPDPRRWSWLQSPLQRCQKVAGR